jgi:nitrate/TMAO reductase-like tetraheme cytochrome c subunit
MDSRVQNFWRFALGSVSLASPILTSIFFCLLFLSFPYQLHADDDLLGDDVSEEELLGEWETGRDESDAGKDVAKMARGAHEQLFAENRYPSAATCATCHQKQYREWSVSSHSYSQLSPVAQALGNTINVLASGSNGDFCLRCHAQVGANLGESPVISNIDRHPASREGITCIVCHRVDKKYDKVSGRIGLVEGGLTEPFFGPTGNAEMERVLSKPDKYKVVTDPDKPGRKIHEEVRFFKPIRTSTFCGSCHDVTLFNGFRLEEAFSEYRMSPAARKGISCQDCHMGSVQGKVSDYEQGPAASIGGVPTATRRITSHLFSGPDYSIIHPGIFPHNTEAQEMATIREWLTFDYKAGWGTDEFENKVASDFKFPKRWEAVDDRYDARAILDDQFELLTYARTKRLEVLRNGYGLGDVMVTKSSPRGIKFKVKVENLTDGHNVPTGFTGERPVWLHVEVKDSDGSVVFESGDVDPNGDYRDDHSSYVRNGEVPSDRYLFTLQSKFVVGNVRGSERERVIPIPYPVTSLPRVLSFPTSLIITGEPFTERNHRKGINPGSHRWAKYKVKGKMLTGKGPYHLNVKLMTQMIPINLVEAIQHVGFDYGMSPRQVGDAVVAGKEVLWEKDLNINVT